MHEGLKIHDLPKFVFVSDPQASPYGDKTVFTVTKPNLEKNDYRSSIWIMDNKTWDYKPLTNGPYDNSPKWNPKGRTISFISRRTLKEGEKGAELWIMDVESKSEPFMLTKMEGGIASVDWNPDGKRILFTSVLGKIDKDVKEINRIPIWFNGKGFIYKRFSHLHVIDLQSQNIEKITEGEINVIFARWSPDGKSIAYIAQESELKPYIANIYVYNTKTGEKIKLTKDNLSIYDLDWSPDGRNLVFRGSDLGRGFASFTKVWIVSIEEKEPRLVFRVDKNAENSANCDMRGASASLKLRWVEKKIYFPVTEGGSVHLYRMDIKGDYEPVITGDIVVDDYTFIRDKILATIMTSYSPLEIYYYDYRNLIKVTSFNDHLISSKKISRPERFTFKASDGQIIEGWILKPVNFTEGEKYPAVLEIHGGPATTYGNGFMFEFHVLSSEGYVVIYTNPRGSSGYSEEFADIRGNYGERDYLDLMEAIDFVVKEYNFIDENRLGVIGGSYGGFMTNWIIGHTDRFKAAVTQRSICNWISFYGTTDIGFYFGPDQMAKDYSKHFWIDDETFKMYWDKSPIKYVKNVNTPLLIIHSEEDYRCWLDQAFQMFTALKVKGVDTKMVLFPDENHDLSRSGKPKHRLKRLEEIINWFNKYLKSS